MLWAIPVQTLVEKGVSYDGKTVVISGEVIGDILYRKNCVWLNVLSPEGTAIGVKATQNQLPAIKMTGNYRQHGDTVSVTGTFSRFNKEELGETMLLADQITLTAPGYLTETPVSLKKALLACSLLLVSFILGFLYTKLFLVQRKQTPQKKAYF